MILNPDDQVHPDTHVLTMVNNVIGVVNYVIAAHPSLLNFMIADKCPGQRKPHTRARLSSAATAPDRNIPGSRQAGRAQVVRRCNQNGTQMARRAPILIHRPRHSEFLHGDRLPVTCRRRSFTQPQGNGNHAARSLDRDKAEELR